ncbi:MAG: hypothetical protein V3T30_08790, partial [Thermodesulfobacteriota bacterium]
EYFGIEAYRVPQTGYLVNKYSIGFPLLVAPFFIVTHLVMLLLKTVGFNVSADGFSAPYQFMVCVGSIFYGYLGLVLSYKLCKKFFSRESSALAVTAIFFTSNIFYYFMREPFMSHLASFFAVTLFIYSWYELRREGRYGLYFLFGLSAGLMILVRQQNIAFLLIPAADLFIGGLASKGRSVEQFTARNVGAVLVGFIPIILMQMMVWKVLFGSFFTYSYGAEPFMYAASPKILQTLFSSRHGLISWNPVILFSFIGLILYIKKKNRMAIYFLIAFLLQLYINSSWHMWWLGYAFGGRGFINCTAIFIVGLAAIMEALGGGAHKKVSFKFTLPVLIILGMWNMVMIVAYVSEMIPYGDYFSWMELFKNLSDLPGAVARKISRL